MKAKPKIKRVAALKRKALQMAKPLYARPKALAARKEAVALRAEHVAQQDAAYRRNEHDRLTAQLSGTMQPQLRAELMALGLSCAQSLCIQSVCLGLLCIRCVLGHRLHDSLPHPSNL